MKKYLIFVLVLAMLCLSGCDLPMLGSSDGALKRPGLDLGGFFGGEPDDFQEEAVGTAPMEMPAEDAVATEPVEMPMEEAEAVLPLPEDGIDFMFASGTGGWSTVITVNRDGSFYGDFRDSEMGDRGEGYSQGTVYQCAFSGRFDNVEQLDEYSYKMTLVEFFMEQIPGEEWFEDDFRFVASDPYGLTAMGGEIATEYILYLPNTPKTHVSEDFLIWWPYRFDEAAAEGTLLSYAIMNVSTYDGFFS